MPLLSTPGLVIGDTGGTSATAAQIVALLNTASTFSGTETDQFTADTGQAFYWQLPLSYIGQQIGALPDVVELMGPGPGGALLPVEILDETRGLSITLLAHYNLISTVTGAVIGQGVKAIFGLGTSKADTVLPARYPGVSVIDSHFATLIVPQLPADHTSSEGIEHFDRYYLEVDGGNGASVLSGFGITDSQQGRFLLTVGAVGGQRDTAWGSWVNQVVMGVPGLPTGPSTTPNDQNTALLGIGQDLVKTQSGSALKLASSNWSYNDTTGVLSSTIQGATKAITGLTGPLVGVLEDAVANTAIQALINGLKASADPLVSAAGETADQAFTQVNNFQALSDWEHGIFEDLQKVTSDPASLTLDDIRAFEQSVNQRTAQMVQSVALNLAGIPGTLFDTALKAAPLVVNIAKGISGYFGHSQPVVSATYSPSAIPGEIILPDGHLLAYAGDGFSGETIVMGSGGGVAYAGSGAKTLVGGPGADILIGGDGADSLSGGPGINTLFGGPGNDTISAGSAASVVVYSGASANYQFTANSAGYFTVTDTRSGSPDGADQILGTALLAFTDKQLQLGDPLLSAQAQAILREDPVAGAHAGNVLSITSAIASAAESRAQSVADVITLARATTSVATLAYEFFTGSAPSAGGMDYLVSPTGPNPNNLNSAYYQSFGLENRYINFASNLGRAGAGSAQFAAQYGNLTPEQAMTKAYQTIFGGTPSTDKVNHLLHDLVPNGVGGSYERLAYFQSYGGDGPSGIGTKAAMVGWLLAEAVKADLGTYALSNDAFLTDVALHNAPFGVDIIGHYAQAGFVYQPG